MPTAPRPGAVAMATMGSWWRASMGASVGSQGVMKKRAGRAYLVKISGCFWLEIFAR
jgi:hypothetical protein